MRDNADTFSYVILATCVAAIVVLLLLINGEDKREREEAERKLQMYTDAMNNTIDHQSRHITYLQDKLDQCEAMSAAHPDSIYYMEGSGW